MAKAPQVKAGYWEWQLQQRLETAMLEGRTQVHGMQFLSLPLFCGLRVLVALLLSHRGREIISKLIGRSKTPDTKATIFELRSIEERRWVMQVCWELLKDWPARFLGVAMRVNLRHADFERSTLMRPFWIDSAFDQLPGIKQRQLSELEVETIRNWLLAKGQQPTWTSILKASGIGVPIRMPQTALKAYLARERTTDCRR